MPISSRLIVSPAALMSPTSWPESSTVAISTPGSSARPDSRKLVETSPTIDIAGVQRAYERLDDHEVAAHIVETLVALDRRDEALQVLVDAESRHADSDLLQDVRERLFPDTD